MDYKIAISGLVEHRDWEGFFRTPDLGVMEHPLFLSDRSGRADFCYEIGDRGRLFVEDDDAPKTLNNLMTYWRWCAANPDVRPVHLIHVIGSNSGVFVEHCRFLKPRIEADLERNLFQYHIVAHDFQWREPQRWLPEIRAVLGAIRQSFRGATPPNPQGAE